MMKYLIVTAFVLSPFVVNADSTAKAIHIGGCGGYTGACGGRIIEDDGTIYATKRPVGAIEDRQLICRNKSIADHLFQKLSEIDFINININEGQNITSYITVEYENESHTVTWWKGEHTPNVDKMSLTLSRFSREVFDLLKSRNCEPPTKR